MPTNEVLTYRQLEIACLLANGRTAEEAAQDLFLSISTVRASLSAARKKVNAKTNAHLVSILIASGDLYWTEDGERAMGTRRAAATMDAAGQAVR